MHIYRYKASKFLFKNNTNQDVLQWLLFQTTHVICFTSENDDDHNHSYHNIQTNTMRGAIIHQITILSLADSAPSLCCQNQKHYLIRSINQDRIFIFLFFSKQNFVLIFHIEIFVNYKYHARKIIVYFHFSSCS